MSPVVTVAVVTVARCVLNWFGDWSTGALYQVGSEFTNKVDLDRSDVSGRGFCVTVTVCVCVCSMWCPIVSPWYTLISRYRPHIVKPLSMRLCTCIRRCTRQTNGC